ncbi:hypothetical protein FOZ63_021162, partial [Perkinsus olseni]
MPTAAREGRPPLPYQNWLQKRSRVTRVFKKRYIVLDGSVVYSFRKVNLARPLDLSSASLWWNIAGCQVIPCPTKSGYIWVVRGGQLNESLYFAAPTLDFANDWIQAMDRASRMGDTPGREAEKMNNDESVSEERRTGPPPPLPPWDRPLMRASVRVVDYLVSTARPACLLPPVVFAELESTLTRIPVIDYHLDAEPTTLESPSILEPAADDLSYLRQRRCSEISVVPGEEQLSPTSDRLGGTYSEVEPTLDPPVEIPLYQRKPRDRLILYVFHPETGYLIGETAIMKYDMRRNLPWTRDSDDQLGGARWCAVVAPGSKQPTAADHRPPSHYVTALKVVPRLTGGLTEYFSPLSESQQTTRRLEFEYFKTQISRFVKLVDLFQMVKAKYNDVVEWRWTFRSSAWLVYCTLLLVVFPQRCHWLLCVHLTLYCIYCNPAVRSGLSRSLTRSFDINAEYVKQRLSEVRPLSFLRASASKDVQQIELTPLLIPELEQAEGVEDTDYVSEIWENQRRLFGGKTFSPVNLLVMDRPRWSNVTGKITLDPPTSSSNITWRIDVVPGPGGTDDNGWRYAWRWGSSAWKSTYSRYDFVRRRRWLPTIATSADPASLVSSETPPEPSTPGLPSPGEPSSARKDDSSYMRKLFGYGPRSSLDTSSPSPATFDYDLYDMATEESQPSLIGGVGRMWKDFREVAWKA